MNNPVDQLSLANQLGKKPINDTIDKPVSLTPEIVKSKMQIVLTKTEQSIQALHDKKKELVFNEDNLEVIKNYLDGCRKINKTVEEERTKMKEPRAKNQEPRRITLRFRLLILGD